MIIRYIVVRTYVFVNAYIVCFFRPNTIYSIFQFSIYMSLFLNIHFRYSNHYFFYTKKKTIPFQVQPFPQQQTNHSYDLTNYTMSPLILLMDFQHFQISPLYARTFVLYNNHTLFFLVGL